MTETHTTGYCAPQISVVEMLTATGCNKEEVSTDVIKYVSEITIGFETRTRVSTSHSTAGLKFAWEDGDVIEVYKNADANSLTYYYVYDAASKTFKPQNKNYKMVAGTEGTIATMHHLVGVIGIPVKKGGSFSEKITQSGIQASGSKIGRDFTATPASPYFKEASEGYEVTDSEEKSEYVLSTTEATSIFIPALPGTYENPKLRYYTSSYMGSKEILGTVTIERGKITRISEQTL